MGVLALLHPHPFLQFMKHNLKKQTRNFTTVSNSLLNDRRLSYKARGILCYLLSKPDDWQVLPKYDIAKRNQDYGDNKQDPDEYNVEGESAVRSGLLELKDAGYMYWQRYYENGKVAGINYYVFDEPQENLNKQNLNQENLNLENLNEENQDEYIKKDTTKERYNKEKNKQKENPDKGASDEAFKSFFSSFCKNCRSEDTRPKKDTPLAQKPWERQMTLDNKENLQKYLWEVYSQEENKDEFTQSILNRQQAYNQYVLIENPTVHIKTALNWLKTNPKGADYSITPSKQKAYDKSCEAERKKEAPKQPTKWEQRHCNNYKNSFLQAFDRKFTSAFSSGDFTELKNKDWVVWIENDKVQLDLSNCFKHDIAKRREVQKQFEKYSGYIINVIQGMRESTRKKT